MGCTSAKKASTANPLKSEKDTSGQTSIIEKDLNKVCQQYILKELLGVGKYGRVFRAESKESGREVAIKVMSRSSSSIAELMQEVEILAELKHASISQYVKHYQTEKYLYVVMEYCKGKQLYTKIIEQDKLPEEEAMLIMEHLLRAISYCHSKKVIHRDLKLENVMYSADGIVKLIDFGLSMKLDGVTSEELVGTAFYIAPEIIRAKMYTKASDMWSLGIMMYVLLSGCIPVLGQTFEEVIDNVKKYKGPTFRQDMWNGISEEAKDLLMKLLEINYEGRISVDEALRHQWFNQRRTTTSCTEFKPEKCRKRAIGKPIDDITLRTLETIT
jgi:calcium-dependent protein kinase